MLFAQSPPGIEWQQCYGGYIFSIVQTFDGGYAVAGYVTSNSGDAWVMKLSSIGAVEWEKTYGGNGPDYVFCIIQTADSGFALAGITGSTDGDLSGYHGGYSDGWALKLSASGNIQWSKCFGGTGYDYLYSIVQTSDGGFAVTGLAGSNDGDVHGNHGGWDAWVIRLSPSGGIRWQKCFGGSSDEYAHSIVRTSDGGFAIAGVAGSFDGQVSGLHGDSTGMFDGWAVKLDSSGKFQWQKCLGGIYEDRAACIVQTSDGGYGVTGFTNSSDGDFSDNHGGEDAWFAKLDSSGATEWKKCLGGSGTDEAYSVIQNSPGQYVICGLTNTGGEGFPIHGSADDAWVVLLGGSGDFIWQKLLGGFRDDWGYTVIRTSDGGYAVAAYSNSTDGNALGNKLTGAWVVKLLSTVGVQGVPAPDAGLHLAAYPDPAEKIVTLGYDLQKASPVEIAIYSVTGEIIAAAAAGLPPKQVSEEQTGHHEVPLDLGAFSEGVYFIKVTAGGLTETTKVEVMK